MRPYREKLRALQLTEQQWRVLRILEANGELEAADLAERAYLLPASLTRILRDLEARALASRRRAPDDQRRVLVVIGRDGQKIIKAAAPHFEYIHDEIAHAFGAGNLAKLQGLLATLEHAMVTLTRGT